MPVYEMSNQTLALWHRVQDFIAIILFSADQREKYWQYIDFFMMRWSGNFTTARE
jgi:hypothetical protein